MFFVFVFIVAIRDRLMGGIIVIIKCISRNLFLINRFNFVYNSSGLEQIMEDIRLRNLYCISGN